MLANFFVSLAPVIIVRQIYASNFVRPDDLLTSSPPCMTHGGAVVPFWASTWWHVQGGEGGRSSISLLVRLNKRSIGPQPALRRVGPALVGWGWLQRSILEILGSPTWDPIWLKTVLCVGTPWFVGVFNRGLSHWSSRRARWSMQQSRGPAEKIPWISDAKNRFTYILYGGRWEAAEVGALDRDGRCRRCYKLNRHARSAQSRARVLHNATCVGVCSDTCSIGCFGRTKHDARCQRFETFGKSDCWFSWRDVTSSRAHSKWPDTRMSHKKHHLHVCMSWCSFHGYFGRAKHDARCLCFAFYGESDCWVRRHDDVFKTSTRKVRLYNRTLADMLSARL